MERRSAELRASLAQVERELADERERAREQRDRDRDAKQRRLEREIDNLIRQIPDRSRLDYRKETGDLIQERKPAELSAWASYWI